jgi:hypothetical protein
MALDDIDKIKKTLKSEASDKIEEKRLIALYDKACEGLSSHTSGGVREEIEELLDGLFEPVEVKAAAIKKMIRE